MKWKKIYAKDSQIEGKGLFALRKIKKGETIFVIKGHIIGFLNHNFNFADHGHNWMGTGDHEWIASDSHRPLTFLNHSCEPNTGIKGKVTVTALRDVDENEEVTIDYSIAESDPHWKMNCRCNTKSCRKIISSIHSLPINYFRKYLPYIPLTFQKIYKNINKQ